MPSKRFESARFDPTSLGESLHFEFSNRVAKNRFLKAAMTERLSTWHPSELSKRGIPTPELINVYKRWGEGRFGVVVTGNTMIECDQLESAGNLVIPRGTPFAGERFKGFEGLAKAIKEHESLALVQLSHPGRQVTEEIQESPISASDVRLELNFGGKTFAKPRAMEKEDFNRVVEGFVHAAEFAAKAGWDGVQIHAAHGYLLAQFLSPVTNKRTDEYGGSLDNRSRLLLEVVNAVRSRVPNNFIVSVKVNSVEFEQGGFSSADCAVLCNSLEKQGVDFVELSGGTYQESAFNHRRESTRRREAFFIEFAEKIVQGLRKTRVYVTGGFRTGSAMVDALKTVHGVGLGRAATHEFDLPHKILVGEVQAAINPLLPEDDYALTNMAAGMQIRLVGKDNEPADLSRADHKDAFEDSLAQWLQSMSDNEDNSKFGGIDLLGVQLHPYGMPYL